MSDFETLRAWAAYIGFPPKARAALDRVEAEVERLQDEMHLLQSEEDLHWRPEVERLREALEQIAKANPADNVTGVWLQRLARRALEGSSDETSR